MLAIRPEDDGVFFCAAQNPAGVARGNFTVRVVDSLENNSDGGLQENTDSYNSQEQESTLTESDDMFQVRDQVPYVVPLQVYLQVPAQRYLALNTNGRFY